MSSAITIACAIIGSSALFTFLQFLITRKDQKKDCLSVVLSKIEDTNKKIEETNEKMLQGFANVDNTIGSLEASLEASKATTARVRILRASDEILHKMRHSKEWFDQLNDDITYYEAYCSAHPEFVNNKARHAIKNINEIYAKAISENDFL